MFGTLQWNARTKTTEFVARPLGHSSTDKYPACDRCRAKKVKCRTNLDDCPQCRRVGKACTFSNSKHKHRRRSNRETTDTTTQMPSADLHSPPSSPATPEDHGSEEDMALWHSAPPSLGGVHSFDPTGYAKAQQLPMSCASRRLTNISTDLDMSYFHGFDTNKQNQSWSCDVESFAPFTTSESNCVYPVSMTATQPITSTNWQSVLHNYKTELYYGDRSPTSWPTHSPVCTTNKGFGDNQRHTQHYQNGHT